ncbi:PepSY-associated TM helix domain-containing protein [Hymenobacter sp. GOD-10R]|uniref:PepSY-associated TM helix domain-containing protein n=1 Tax=Hymenobacter sp. GOD-10R TaxID=3093922 RepID=UPI002D7A02FA|nr:PepSY-associated TM helix domain-containing protein [Hymenobacter sp. GOD-10R]WRQ30548.1 PepSY-associated TM helix domain-containing protein [Hymenobacter sp. GOD-10R]
MKVFFRRIHLYLGLVSGLFLVIVCLTGSILVFEKELEQSWHAERYFVEAAATPRLSLAQITEAVRTYKPKAKISGVKVYADPTRSVEVSLAGAPGGPGGAGKGEQGGGGRSEGMNQQRGEGQKEGMRGQQGEQRGEGQQGAAGGKGGPGGKGGRGGDNGPRVFVNPYTGAVLGEMNPRESFFHSVEQIHRGLVAGRIGKTVMGINSIIFLFILGTGLVLWWPTARRMFSQRLTIKWGSSWKRLNHDFHIVLGFYSSLFLFIMALTGAGMSFDWVTKTINTLTHSPQQRPEPPTSTATGAGTPTMAADAVLAFARQQAPDAESFSVQLPKEPTGSIRVAMLRPGAPTENATDEVYLDQYSGKILRQQAYAERPAGQKIRGLFKPVHTGAIFGLPTKILAFIIVLLGATFPITGTILWWNRTNKSKKKQQKPLAVALS